MKERFKRLPNGEAIGFRISTRLGINPSLEKAEAYDEDRFLHALRKLFGEPDQPGDSRLSYSILDLKNNVVFEAFCGHSAPSYGGTIAHFQDIGTATLKAEVKESLMVFDKLIEANNSDA
ncbi:hypothetical protein [Spirosoma panaciterrae]|uniref:hypothetical protein n=1 Tax=Spirosoma panaciterrae TaxID=496058 RepID=UPI0003708411|nr:hypothetical protein [Spirosoma panaciterrae]